ncbi:MAG: C4-dicarboxylate ABC transporter substrate-binding protein [Alphaproteobacteria bacterium]|nr:C4-dicarboxylate ABC transporter substrate-binding protein [Alphaproteobacteria bacterium]
MRKFLNVLACAALLLASGSAFAADSTWRFASKMPPDSPEGKVFSRFADLANKYSGGTLKVVVYPNEQLGKVDAVLEQLKLGTVHIYGEGSAFMRKWVPDINWISAAFLFDDRDHWVRFMNSDLAKSWYRQASEKAGIVVLGDPTVVLRGPYRVMVTKRDVKKFDDLKGLKLRMHSSKTAVATWTHLGTDVKNLAWTDVYQSIDKGIVEAVNSPIALVEAMRFYEVAPHVIRHDEYYQSIGFMMNKKAYDKLDDKQRAALNQAYTEAGAYSHKIMSDVTGASIDRMKAKGVTFVDVDRKPFVSSMRAFYDKFESEGKLPKGFLTAVEAARRK